ncbi:acyl-CoA carboxylase subunit epsilon [Arthrobacter sp. zg-Y1171]|uniref:acyl-CoA carboxylase subunit epsilon n=1 Tax=Arthrobacter sp. zg-Y1171 TaxID=2964610 RepID=UPI0021051203|nr:acyl-CoA carboxylase subunit epsilon [Arthrobacter sp. zg-Y1171]MCQ1996206.1 acyl-CoA carboxylase subunit epsilon [Arthrobacter sp. zg-Y1171]UWX82738.1 acyl-CoA carboxylase subunit epsilon [Arthrobacter sp. zg-Y1171]
MSIDGSTPEPASEPLFSVVSGSPTDEELAALTAVVAGLGAQAAPLSPARPAHRAWARRRNLRLDPKPGPGSWRRSYR